VVAFCTEKTRGRGDIIDYQQIFIHNFPQTVRATNYLGNISMLDFKRCIVHLLNYDYVNVSYAAYAQSAR
jgi:hypothetical protein